MSAAQNVESYEGFRERQQQDREQQHRQAALEQHAFAEVCEDLHRAVADLLRARDGFLWLRSECDLGGDTNIVQDLMSIVSERNDEPYVLAAFDNLLELMFDPESHP
jgi:hypothetical protein